MIRKASYPSQYQKNGPFVVIMGSRLDFSQQSNWPRDSGNVAGSPGLTLKCPGKRGPGEGQRTYPASYSAKDICANSIRGICLL